MHNIYYPSEDSLVYFDGNRNINSFLWRFLYKRVQNKLKNSIITIENIKKVVSNKKLLTQCKIDGNLPFVILRRAPVLYYTESGEEYFIPFSICFMDGKRKYDIVLVDGEIDLRDDSKRGESLNKELSHTPVLLVKVFKNIEKSFRILLEYIKKEEQL